MATTKKVAGKAASKKVAAGKQDGAVAPSKAKVKGVGQVAPRKPPRKPSADESGVRRELTAKERQFVNEYLVDLNASAAAARCGYSKASAYAEGYRLLRKAQIAPVIKAAMDERARRTEVKADEVVAMLRDIAFADPRELFELRRNCCRYCWSENHRFQRTQVEMEKAMADHAKAQEADHQVGDFDELGGTGFNANRLPNKECPECFGDGVMEPFFHDVRMVSPAAARLFSGMKTTKDGLEIKTHNQVEAAIQLGRHLGLFNDKLKLAGKVEHDATEELKQFLMNRDSRLPIHAG